MQELTGQGAWMFGAHGLEANEKSKPRLSEGHSMISDEDLDLLRFKGEGSDLDF